MGNPGPRRATFSVWPPGSHPPRSYTEATLPGSGEDPTHLNDAVYSTYSGRVRFFLFFFFFFLIFGKGPGRKTNFHSVLILRERTGEGKEFSLLLKTISELNYLEPN